MELSHQAQPPTRQAASTAPAQAASGQNGQNKRKRSLSATDVQQCDTHGSGSSRRAQGDEPQQQQSCAARDIGASAPPIGHGAPEHNGTAAAETFADGLDGGAKGAAAATKKVFLGPTPGATLGAGPPTLEALEARGSGGPPINYCVGRGGGALGVESEGPPLQASSKIGAFPYHTVFYDMQGGADCKIVNLQHERTILPRIIGLVRDVLKSYDKDTLNMTSLDVRLAVDMSRNACASLLLDPEQQAPLLVGSLDDPHRLAQVLRHTVVELDRTLHEVFEFLEEEEPRSRLATLDNTRPGGSCASPYDQLRLLLEFLREITRVPPQSTMQEASGLLDVLCVLHARAASLTAPRTTTPPSTLVKKPSSTESVAPKLSLTNNVKPTAVTAVSSEAPPPSEDALNALVERAVSYKNKQDGADCFIDLDAELDAEEQKIVPEILELLQDLRDTHDDSTLDLTSHNVISAVERLREVCGCLVDPAERAKLDGPLTSPARVAHALRQCTVLVDVALQKVHDCIGDDEDPRHQIADWITTSKHGIYADPYIHLDLVTRSVEEILHCVPLPQNSMQEASGLRDVIRVLQARALSLAAPATTTTPNSVTTASSTEPVLPKPSSSTVATSPSAPDATAEPSNPPPPPRRDISSILDGVVSWPALLESRKAAGNRRYGVGVVKDPSTQDLLTTVQTALESVAHDHGKPVEDVFFKLGVQQAVRPMDRQDNALMYHPDFFETRVPLVLALVTDNQRLKALENIGKSHNQGVNENMSNGLDGVGISSKQKFVVSEKTPGLLYMMIVHRKFESAKEYLDAWKSFKKEHTPRERKVKTYDAAVGDWVTIGDLRGVVEALPCNECIWWKVRIDGELRCFYGKRYPEKTRGRDLEKEDTNGNNHYQRLVLALHSSGLDHRAIGRAFETDSRMAINRLVAEAPDDVRAKIKKERDTANFSRTEHYPKLKEAYLAWKLHQEGLPLPERILQPFTLYDPTSMHVDDLIGRNAPIERTNKPYRITTTGRSGIKRPASVLAATTTREYLEGGCNKTALKYDLKNGYFRVVDAPAPGVDGGASAGTPVVTTPEMLAVLGNRSRKPKVPRVGGCTCKKSRCLKRFCPCVKAGIECVAECKCLDCQNGRPASVDQVAPRAPPSVVLPPSPRPLKRAATAPPASPPSQPEPSKKRSAPLASKPKPKKKFKPKDAVMEAFVKRITQPYAPPPPRPPAVPAPTRALSDLEESDSEVVDMT